MNIHNEIVYMGWLIGVLVSNHNYLVGLGVYLLGLIFFQERLLIGQIVL